MNKKLLFFSRGRGYGHAIPDLEIAREIEKLSPEYEISFVSYATGAKVIKDKWPLFYDLDLPENNSFLLTLYKALEIIIELKPDAILSHEEFSAVVAAGYAKIPVTFISAWLPMTGGIHAESLAFATTIIILGDPGIFPITSELRTKPIFLGSLSRDFGALTLDRATVRKNWDILPNAFLILVIPGGHASESDTPIADRVLSAYLGLTRPEKMIIWVSSKDNRTIREKTKYLSNVRVYEFVDKIEELIAAADIVITKGTRGTTLDAAALGVPSISISHGENIIDDHLVPRIPSNIALNSGAVDGDVLLHYINQIDASKRTIVEYSKLGKCTAQAAAKVIVSKL